MIQLKIYADVNIQDNHYIESIEDYLAPFEVTGAIKETEILCKDFDSDEDAFTIKVTNQGDVTEIQRINYIRMQEIDIRYYHVVSHKRLSEKIWQLALELDVVNTYQSEIKNTTNLKQVRIARRHKNRWYQNSTDKSYYRVFDKVDEELGDHICSEVESKQSINSNDCYLVSRSIDTVEDQKFYNYSSQLFSRVYDNEGTTIYKIDKYKWNSTLLTLLAGALNTWKSFLIKSDNNDPLWFNLNGYTIIGDMICLYAQRYAYQTTIYLNVKIGVYSGNGDNYTCLNVFSFNTMGKEISDLDVYCEGMNFFSIYKDCACAPNVGSKAWAWSDLLGSGTLLAENDVEEISTTIPSIKSLNKSDSAIKTIINIPVNINSSDLIWFNCGVNAVFNQIIVDENSIDLNKTNVKTTLNKEVTTRSQELESKLYGSYIRNHYIAYDSFSLPCLPEYLVSKSALKVTTYIPNDMTNNICIQANGIKETTYKSNILTCSRNNNLSVFSNEYLEYIRNGYNYDEKSKTMSNLSNWMSFGSSLVGAGVSATQSKKNAFTGANAISMGINAMTSLTSSIMSSIQNEQSLANKRNQILNSSASMSGSDDVVIFRELTGGNKIQYIVEKPNDEVLNNIYNLFYYNGYADNMLYDTMPTIKTREYFNYIQATIGQCDITNNKVRSRIVLAYAQGITFEWKYNNTWLAYGNLYENWETNIK